MRATSKGEKCAWCKMREISNDMKGNKENGRRYSKSKRRYSKSKARKWSPRKRRDIPKPRSSGKTNGERRRLADRESKEGKT